MKIINHQTERSYELRTTNYGLNCLSPSYESYENLGSDIFLPFL